MASKKAAKKNTKRSASRVNSRVNPKTKAAESGQPLVQPIGHDEWLQGLWQAKKAGRLPHALLLTGRDGIGKFTAARWFAAGLLCAQGPAAPCLQCGPCKRLLADTHPDFLVVDARAHGLDTLTVAFFAPRREARSSGYSDQSVGEFLSLRSAEGGARVVLVREAERMNISAQNAFLKTLEEPAPGTILVLETSQPGELLATLHSRVIGVAVPAPAPAQAAMVLDRNGVGLEQRDALVVLAQGSPGLALVYERENRLGMRDLLLACLRGQMGPVQTRTHLMALPGEFVGKTPTAQTRARARCVLDLALQLMRDWERALAGVALQELAHGSVLQEMPAWNRGRRRTVLQALLGIRADVGLNLGAESLLDRALLVLSPGPQNANTKLLAP